MILNILLIRPDLKVDRDILENSDLLEKVDLELPDGDTGVVVPARLYFERRPMRFPPWASFFTGFLGQAEIPTITSAPACLIAPVDDRLFAIVFSYGQSLLNTGSFDPSFGLSTALNSISPVKVRSYDRRRFDALFRQTREQASRETKLENFGIDAERDLVRKVEGKPEDPELGSSMSGGHSLRVSCKLSPKQLIHYLRRLYRKYRQNTYLEEYPWLGRIEEIKDSALNSTLDSYLDEKVSKPRPEGIWLAVPDIIDWSSASGFRFILPTRCDIVFPDIELRHLIKALGGNTPITADLLRRQRVEMLDVNDDTLNRWSLYSCVNCEVMFESESYVLSSGCWYRIEADLMDEVNREINTLPAPSFDLPEYLDSDKDEFSYNQRVAQDKPEYFCCLDRKNIMFGGGRSRFELCDLLTADGDLVHVKRYGGSSVLSHLFAQGMVSGDLLMRRPSFRARADELVEEHEFSLPEGATKLRGAWYMQ